VVASTKSSPGFKFGFADSSGSGCQLDRSQNVVDLLPFSALVISPNFVKKLRNCALLRVIRLKYFARSPKITKVNRNDRPTVE